MFGRVLDTPPEDPWDTESAASYSAASISTHHSDLSERPFRCTGRGLKGKLGLDYEGAKATSLEPVTEVLGEEEEGGPDEGEELEIGRVSTESNDCPEHEHAPADSNSLSLYVEEGPVDEYWKRFRTDLNRWVQVQKSSGRDERFQIGPSPLHDYLADRGVLCCEEERNRLWKDLRPLLGRVIIKLWGDKQRTLNVTLPGTLTEAEKALTKEEEKKSTAEPNESSQTLLEQRRNYNRSWPDLYARFPLVEKLHRLLRNLATEIAGMKSKIQSVKKDFGC